MDEQEQSSAQATQTQEAGADTAPHTFHAEEVMEQVMSGTESDVPPPPPAPDPEPPTESAPPPADHGAIHALLDEIHHMVGYSHAEVQDNVRALVARIRALL